MTLVVALRSGLPAVLWSRYGGAAGLMVGVGVGLGCGGVGGDCRWYCLIARWFAISGACMMALHSDILGGRFLYE
ncbi:MAG: hypothetical protein C5S48_03150 [Candidatus Methanogaster sp.]|nr:MAG: hypothetical protein C5S48_03150 [ANME-2 cluster archaeon]